MAAKYYRTPENPHASSVGFMAVNEDITDKDRLLDSPTHPAVQVNLYKGYYDYGDHRRDGSHNTDRVFANIRKDPGEQLKMFGHVPSKIDEAFADHRMQANTPTVLGMAINEAKKIGMGLTYSDDLSEHSSKIAQKGIESGAVSRNPSNPDAEQRNDIAYQGRSTYTHRIGSRHLIDYDPASSDEVKAGRETIRGIVKEHRASKKDHIGPQFNHPDLDVVWHQPELGD